MKRNQKGLSLVAVILVICIILVCGVIYYSLTGSETNLAEQNYSYEPISNGENAADGFYYNQLPNPAKIMYNTILGNIEQLKIGNGEIKFPDSVGESIKEINGSAEENYFQTAWDALALEHLDLFYIDTQNLSLSTRTTSILGYESYDFTLSPKDGNLYYSSTFNSKEEVESAIAQVNEIADNIVANAKGSTYDKVKYVHDWIVDNVEYDNDDLDNNDNIYGTFVNKKVVCEGYAEALKFMLDKLNIPCVLVYGEGYDDNGNTEAHAWNYVQMDDEKWYAVDPTWDDPIYVGSANGILTNSKKYAYFLKGSDTFNKNHVSDGDVSGTGQDFKYPELSKEDYK